MDERAQQNRNPKESTMKRAMFAMAAIGIGLLSVAGSARAASTRVNDESSAALISKLQDADRSDRLNAESWSSDNASLDHYYDRKSEEVENVLKQLQNGRPVSPDTVSRALDNSGAQSF